MREEAFSTISGRSRSQYTFCRIRTLIKKWRTVIGLSVTEYSRRHIIDNFEFEVKRVYKDIKI